MFFMFKEFVRFGNCKGTNVCFQSLTANADAPKQKSPASFGRTFTTNYNPMNIVEISGFSEFGLFQRGLAMRTVPFLILIVTGVLITT